MPKFIKVKSEEHHIPQYLNMDNIVKVTYYEAQGQYSITIYDVSGKTYGLVFKSKVLAEKAFNIITGGNVIDLTK